MSVARLAEVEGELIQQECSFDFFSVLQKGCCSLLLLSLCPARSKIASRQNKEFLLKVIGFRFRLQTNANTSTVRKKKKKEGPKLCMGSPKSRKVLPHVESGSGSCRQMRLHAPSSNAENNNPFVCGANLCCSNAIDCFFSI